MSTKTSEEILHEKIQEFVSENVEKLNSSKIRRLSILVFITGEQPCSFSFRSDTNFSEDKIYRNMEISDADHIELIRLSNYELERIQNDQHQIFVFMGSSKTNQKVTTALNKVKK